MVDFDAMLKKSLSVVNDGYVDAMNDVNAVVEKLRNAIKQNAGEQFAFECSEVHSSITDTTFRIYLDTDYSDLHAPPKNICFVRIPVTGYPIEVGTFNKNAGLFVASGDQLTSKIGLENFFAELLQNPESVLIQTIGFALRQKVKK